MSEEVKEPGFGAPPAETPDCCEVWAELLPNFRWFSPGPWPELACMPYLPGKGQKRWRIHHCPSCGAPRQDTFVRIERTLTTREVNDETDA